jgi:hypothetical protein
MINEFLMAYRALAVFVPCSLIQRSTRSWSRSSGIAPPLRISFRKDLMSNLEPSSRA